jgi:hypothetical protein
MLLHLVMGATLACPIGFAAAAGAGSVNVSPHLATSLGIIAAIASFVFFFRLWRSSDDAVYAGSEGEIVHEPTRRSWLAVILWLLWFIVASFIATIAIRGIPATNADWVRIGLMGAFLGGTTLALMRRRSRQLVSIRQRDGRCKRCGYSLSGIEGALCPECAHDNT